MSFPGLAIPADRAGSRLSGKCPDQAGIALRRSLLAGAGISLPGDLGPAGEKTAVDDVPDAAAAARTAVRVLRGQARSTPSPPKLFSDGLASSIWT